MLIQRSLAYCKTKRVQRAHAIGQFSSKIPSSPSSTDVLGLPLSPPWSVHALIGSYPSPTFSDATLRKLYDSAALLPPEADPNVFAAVKEEMADLVGLVEAVKMAPDELVGVEGLPDGRIWSGGTVLVPEDVKLEKAALPSGQDLLKHAKRTDNGYYLVDRAQGKT